MAETKIIASGPVSTGQPVHFPLLAVAAVLLGASMANIDSRMFSIGLPDLKGAFSLSFDEGAWLSTASTASQIFIAPAVAWLATTFGLRRILGAPSIVFAVISLILPFVRDYPTVMALTILHGLLLGTFVPATLMIIFRNLPMQWWLIAIGIYASELVTHTWDLARALGVDDTLNQQLAAGVLPQMQRALPPEPRGAEIGVPFGPVVAVGADATPYEALVGWLGRNPEWTCA